MIGHECPTHVPALLANAVLAYDAKQTVRALQLLDTLFGIQKVHPEAAMLRARIALEEGNVPFVVRFLREHIAYTPDSSGLHEVYASALYSAGRLDEARREIDMASKLGAPWWRVMYHMGLIEEASGNLNAAEKNYEEALRGKPGWQQPLTRLNALRASRKQ
jgi:predicted Zn-dependent protease